MFDDFFAADKVGKGCKCNIFIFIKTQQIWNCTKLVLKKFVEYANGNLRLSITAYSLLSLYVNFYIKKENYEIKKEYSNQM